MNERSFRLFVCCFFYANWFNSDDNRGFKMKSIEDMTIREINEKYYAIRDGVGMDSFCLIDREFAHQLENQYPGVFEPNWSFFDTPIIEEYVGLIIDKEDLLKFIFSCLKDHPNTELEFKDKDFKEWIKEV